jgi:pimeloyl-ACP methyl ester carboxylesterase
MRWLLRLGAAALILYAVTLAALYFNQRALLYPRSTRQIAAAQADLPDFQDVTLLTPDGERLVAWWKPPRPGKTVIVYLHGNGGSLWDRRNRGRILTANGRGLLLVSYRGYSGSTGEPTEEGLRIDARTAYAWVARTYEPARVVLYGESLGTGVAVHLASERPVGGVILDAPYTSTAEVGQMRYWYAPVSWLMLDQFRSMDVIGSIRAPLLVLHGDQDSVIPFRFGERLFEAAREPKQFIRLRGAGHTRNLESGGMAAVEAFLTRIEAGFERMP